MAVMEADAMRQEEEMQRIIDWSAKLRDAQKASDEAKIKMIRWEAAGKGVFVVIGRFKLASFVPGIPHL